MTTRGGRRCTATRGALAPAGLVDEVVGRLTERLSKVAVGDPRREDVRMGPLVSLDQRDEVERAVSKLADGADGAEVCVGTGGGVEPLGAVSGRSGFLEPSLL